MTTSSYRRIAPLKDTKGRIVPGGAIQPRPTFQSVAPTSLLVDEAYQRSLSERSEKMIRDIVRGWSWTRFKPPVVVETGNGLVVIDGQHTATAAATRGIPLIPVLIVDAPDVRSQARAFLGHNTMRVAVTKTQIFQAAVTAGDEDAITALQVCGRARVHIVLTPPGRPFLARETMAVSAVVALARKHGAQPARQILQAVADGGVAPIKAVHIRAAELLMRDKRYASPRMGYSDLTAAVARYARDEDTLVRKRAAEFGSSQYEALAAIWHNDHFARENN